MDTREKILGAAKAEFARYGLAGARVDRIARHSKVNKAMIYYHFRSKDGLYEAVLESHIAKIGNFLQEISAESTNLEEILRRIADFYYSTMELHQEFLPIFLREIAAGGDKIEKALTKIIAEKGLAKKMRKLIDDGTRDGRLRPVDSRQAIISFISMNLFYLLMAPSIKSVWEIKDEKKFRRDRPAHIVDLFLNGIRARN